MSHAETSDNAPAAVPVTPLLTWRSHPIAESGSRAGLVIAIMIGLPGILLVWYGPFYSLLGFVILAGSLGPFFLPTEYTLYEEGLEKRFIGIHQRFVWDQFRSFYPDKHGVLLSPFPRPSRLENFRGFYLRFGAHRDSILEIVRAKVAAPRGDDDDADREAGS